MNRSWIHALCVMGSLTLLSIPLIGGCGSSSDTEDNGDGTDEDGSDFSLTSPDFTAGGTLPADSACTDLGGNNEIPTFSWTNTPTGTQSFALVFEDLTVPTVHMVLLDIPATTTEIDDTDPFDDSDFADNYLGERGYAGPCPPSGGGPHTYQMTIYALERLDLIPEEELSDTDDAIDTIQGNALDSAAITGTFEAP